MSENEMKIDRFSGSDNDSGSEPYMKATTVTSDRISHAESITMYQVTLNQATNTYVKPFDFQKVINLSKSEIYINKCMLKHIASVYKQDFTKGTSEKIKKLFPIKKREIQGFNIERIGNDFAEIVTTKNGTEKVYFSEAPGWIKGVKKYGSTDRQVIKDMFKGITKEEIDECIKNGVTGYFQNQGTEYQTFIPEWNNDPKTGSLARPGHYIYHIQRYNGSIHYGSPDWLSDTAQDSINIIKFAKKHNLSLFVNAMEPRKIIIVKRNKDKALDTGVVNKIKNFFKHNFGPIEKTNKSLIIETNNMEVDIVDVIKKGENEGDYISLEDQAKIDISIAADVPPIIVGLQFAGKLGAGQEISESYNIYYNDTVIPKRNVYYEFIKDILPEEGEPEFEPIYIPKKKTETAEFIDKLKDLQKDTIMDYNK